jgi:glutamate racemase
MIGIYDSGIGGLGIFNAIKQVLPTESMTYFADNKYFPFGDRTAEDIRTIATNGLKKLAQTCQVIVIACNTASVNDLDYYRSQITVPVIGVVPVIKTAAALSKNKHIALLATTVTAKADYTERLIEQFAHGNQVDKLACPGLASAIEYGTLTPAQLDKYLAPIGDADIVVLGCTHYTLIKGDIQRKVGPDVKVIDSNEAVARQTLRVLQQQNLLSSQHKSNYIFECSGDRVKFLEQIKHYAHLH